LRVETLFRTTDASRDKFLARLFGLFSEEIVRGWCANEKSKYKNLGRPRVRTRDREKEFILDFTLQDRKSQEVFVSEQKFWPEYQGYRFLRLDSADSLEGFATESFRCFRLAAMHPESVSVFINRNLISISGGIFITGAVTSRGFKELRQVPSFRDVLTLEQLIDDLRSWNDRNYEELLAKRRAWSLELIDGLLRAG